MNRNNIPDGVITYLSLFYGFCLSTVVYLLLISLLPLPKIIPSNPQLLPFLQAQILPYSHKLIAYALALVQIPSLSIVFHLFIVKYYKNYLPRLENISIILTILIFSFVIIQSLASFSYYQGLLKVSPIIFLPSFLVVFFIGIVLLIRLFFQPNLLNAIHFHKKLFAVINYCLLPAGIILIFLTLIDRTFAQPYLFVGKYFQYFHTAAFIAPIVDVLNGRILLVNSVSQYGILVTLLPALIFKNIIPLSFVNYFYLMIGYAIFYYFFLFILLRKRLGGVWAILGLIVFFTFHFYAGVDRYVRPQYFPVRYVFDLPFFLILFILEKQKLRFSHLLLSMYLALAVLYNMEVGFALTLTYMGYFLLKDFLNKRGSRFVGSISGLMRKLFILTSSILSAFLLYSLWAKVSSGVFPDWGRSLFFLKTFAGGVLVSDGPIFSFYLLPLSIYLIFIVRFYHSLTLKRYGEYFCFDAALVLYGIIIFVNFVERSYLPNLVPVSVPAIFIGLIWFKELWVKRASKFVFFAPYLMLGSLLVFAIIFYVFRVTGNRSYQYWGEGRNESERIYQEVLLASEAVKKYTVSTRQAALVSYFDVLLSVQSGKINSLPYTTSLYIFTKPQALDVLNYLTVTKPKLIFADKGDWLQNNVYPSVYDFIFQNYNLKESVGIINIWELK